MAGVRTLYDILGVESDASAADLRRAYLAAARHHHPDGRAAWTPAETELAEHEMREINRAWATLSKPAERALYDRGRLGGGFEPFGAFVGADGRPRPGGLGDHDRKVFPVPTGDEGARPGGRLRGRGLPFRLATLLVLTLLGAAVLVIGGGTELATLGYGLLGLAAVLLLVVGSVYRARAVRRRGA